MVPNGWLSKSLEELTSEKLAYGANAAACDFYENGLRYIRITDIDDQGNLNNKVVGIEESLGTSYRLQDNDFLFARSGNTVGKTFLFEESIHPKSAYAGYLIRYRPNQNKLLPQYLKQFCFSDKYENWIKSQIRAGAQPNINAKEYGSMEIPLPPLPEQQKIAKILSTWDRAISTTERLIDNSKHQKKALMQQLLTGKKRLLDDSSKGFEGEWNSIQLSKVVKVTGGNAFKSEEFKEVGVPLIRISNIKVDYSINIDSSVFISSDKKHDRFQIVNGDVLIAMSGATTGKIGRYNSEAPAYLNQRVGRFDVKKGLTTRLYIFHLLKLPKVQHEILIDAVGGAQPNISNKDIERIKITIPCIKEQQKIAAVLTNADQEIDLLEQQLADLQQEKKALMQQLLTGKRRVKGDGAVA